MKFSLDPQKEVEKLSKATWCDKFVADFIRERGIDALSRLSARGAIGEFYHWLDEQGKIKHD